MDIGAATICVALILLGVIGLAVALAPAHQQHTTDATQVRLGEGVGHV